MKLAQKLRSVCWDTPKTQRRCLSEWLSSSTGEKVEVESILSLPGWKVERIGCGPIFVINPKRPHAFFLRHFEALPPRRIQAIAHQLEQRCRTVEPVAPRPHGARTKG